jgi:hypothetical protein
MRRGGFFFGVDVSSDTTETSTCRATCGRCGWASPIARIDDAAEVVKLIAELAAHTAEPHE